MTDENEILMIESSTLADWISADDVCLYDVREEYEFAKARICLLYTSPSPRD